jgi:hypothetical protein
MRYYTCIKCEDWCEVGKHLCAFIAQWQRNVQWTDYDCVGCNWIDWISWENLRFPHYQGNFWMAKSDWIRKLPEPAVYAKLWIGHKMWHDDYPWERLAAEMWVGCRHTNRVISLLARNEWWGSGEDIFNHAP